MRDMIIKILQMEQLHGRRADLIMAAQALRAELSRLEDATKTAVRSFERLVDLANEEYAKRVNELDAQYDRDRAELDSVHRAHWLKLGHDRSFKAHEVSKQVEKIRESCPRHLYSDGVCGRNQ